MNFAYSPVRAPRFAAACRRLALLTIIALLVAAAPASAYSYASSEPVFESVSLYPASVAPGAPVSIYVLATDADGVRDGLATLESPSGKQSVAVHLHWDYQSAWLTGTFTPGPYHEGGLWHVTRLLVWDNEGEYADISDPGPAGAFTLTGTGTPDLTPPVASAPRLTPGTVAAGQPFAFEVALSDDLSGVAGGTVTIGFFGTGADGVTPKDYATETQVSLVARGDVWRGEFVAPADPGPARRLFVSDLDVWDAAGNHLALDRASLKLELSVAQPSLPDVGGLADDCINVFYGRPLPFADWAERDLARLGELYGLAYSDPVGTAGTLVDEIADLNAALKATEGDLLMPARPAGLRLASPGVSGRLLALAGALRGRLAIYSLMTTNSTLTFGDVTAWADMAFPLEPSMGPMLAEQEQYEAYGEVMTDIIARGLAESTIPSELYASQHLTRPGWNDDLLPDNVIWLTPYRFSDNVVGYHDAAEGDIFIGLDQWALEQPLETIDTAIHELGHHIHSALLGDRDSAAWADYLNLRGVPQNSDVGVGHDGLREEAFAEDTVEAYAPQAVINATDYTSPYPGPDEVADLGGVVRGFVAGQLADGLPDLFLLTNPGREIGLTASTDFPLTGRAAPGENVTLWLTDDLAGFLEGPFYGNTTTIIAGPDGRFSEPLSLWGDGVYVVQAEVERNGGTFVETGFLVCSERNPLPVTWTVPADTPLAELPISGTAPAGAVVTVNGISGIAGSDGRFAVTVPLAPGANDIALTVTTIDGRTRRLTSDVSSNPFAAIAVDPLPQAVRTASITVSGVGPASQTVVISGGASLVSTRAGRDGKFSAAVPLKSGTNRLEFHSTGPGTVEVAVKYDASATLSEQLPASTNRPRLIIGGQAEPGATVTVNGVSTPVDAAGGFVAVVRPTAAGTPVSVAITDAAGNTTKETRTVALSGTPPAMPTLKDLSGHWSRSAVESLIALGVVGGMPSGTYQPDRSITRAEYVKMLAMAMGLAPDSRAYPALSAGATGVAAERLPFIDIAGHWANGYIQAAVRAGFVVPTDYAEGRFDPDGAISRREIAAMAVRALGLSEAAGRAAGGSSGEAQYVDAASIGPEWEGYAAIAQTEGVLTGLPGGVFGPDQPTTRAQAATVISRVLAKLER